MAPYTVKTLDKFGRTIEEKVFNYISNVVDYYLSSINNVKVFDANGTEIPEDMLIF